MFDSFRRILQRERRYEKIWNSNKGWFKLAHVCREWRQVVLTSPSRLRLWLLFTNHRFGRSIALGSLPPLPIAIHDKRDSIFWPSEEQHRLISGLAHPDRVCAIAFNMPYQTWDPNSKMLAAVSQPFPALESLELYCPRRLGSTPPPFLAGQAPHLRHLKFLGIIADLYRILPYTKSLVDLTLGLHIITFSPLETQLLAHLQDVSSLRRLKVEMDGPLNAPPSERGEVYLPSLTYFSFTGVLALLDALIAGLMAPSLQEFRISLPGIQSTFPHTHTHLTSFIRNTGRQFFSAQFDTSEDEINIIMSARPDSTDDIPFRIIASGICSIPLMGDLFSETLATVEDVFLASPFDLESLESFFDDPVQSYTFFMSFPSAKILRVFPEIELEIGDIFVDEDLPLDILPSLEEIELNATMPSCTSIRIDEDQAASVLELFEPFVDVRKQAGHVVKLHWNTDGALPGYFCDTDMCVHRCTYLSLW